MPSETRRGYALAERINRALGNNDYIVELCSLLARRARAYSTIQEIWCNVELSERATRRLELKESRIEQLITEGVAKLPAPANGQWRVEFEGDPRGNTVKLITPDNRTIGMDD